MHGRRSANHSLLTAMPDINNIWKQDDIKIVNNNELGSKDLYIHVGSFDVMPPEEAAPLMLSVDVCTKVKYFLCFLLCHSTACLQRRTSSIFLDINQPQPRSSEDVFYQEHCWYQQVTRESAFQDFRVQNPPNVFPRPMTGIVDLTASASLTALWVPPSWTSLGSSVTISFLNFISLKMFWYNIRPDNNLEVYKC